MEGTGGLARAEGGAWAKVCRSGEGTGWGSSSWEEGSALSGDGKSPSVPVFTRRHLPGSGHPRTEEAKRGGPQLPSRSF